MSFLFTLGISKKEITLSTQEQEKINILLLSSICKLSVHFNQTCLYFIFTAKHNWNNQIVVK